MNNMEDDQKCKPRIEITLECERSANFAFQQAAIPLIHELRIENKSDIDVANGVVSLRSEPSFFEPLEIRFEALKAGTAFVKSPIKLDLSPSFFAERREKTVGAVCIAVTGDDSSLEEKRVSVEALAYNEWSGLHSLPEILAAFVTPNQPAIAALLQRAGEHLKRTTGSSAMDGYQQNDPRRVYRMVEAIYQSVCQQQIMYVTAPASFESSGQKIRFPEEVCASRQGNCLDLSLLFAACLEQAGLFPLVLIEDGHAYAGAWLREAGFGSPSNEDAQAIRKRHALGELCVFEAVAANEGQGRGFSNAEQLAVEHLENDDKFHFALDIRRCRASRIHPLPVGVSDGRIFVAPPPPKTGRREGVGDSELEERFHDVDTSTPQTDDEPQDRVSHWRNQLLDLSLRNRLLHFNKIRCLQVLTENVADLEDRIAANVEFQLLSGIPADPRRAELHQEQHGESLEAARIKSDLSAKKLRIDATNDRLQNRLIVIGKDADLAIDEGGANILFLAVGILEWKETERTDKIRNAPLLLIPVSLDRKSVRSGFRLKKLDEDTQVNVTLLEKLQQDFGLEINGVNPPPEDESGIDVPLVLRRFRTAIKDVPGFEVRDEAWLGLFSFTKFLLWKDLTDRLDDLKKNDVVRHLIETPGQPYESELSGPVSEHLDEALRPDSTFCVLEADSSQLEAVYRADRGESFVLFGPPGTGKSQTIANIVSQSLAKGKTVLFVAEKRAALEVVHRRLDACGLGPFCLELHSNKSGKGSVMSQFKESLEFVHKEIPDAWEHHAAQLHATRTDLNEVVRALHRRLKNGYSAYRCHGGLLHKQEIGIRLKFTEIAGHDVPHTHDLKQTVTSLKTRGEEFWPIVEHSLNPMRVEEWSPSWEEELISGLERLQSEADRIQGSLAPLIEQFKLDCPAWQPANMNALRQLALGLCDLPDVTPKLAENSSPETVRAEAEQALHVVAQFNEARSALNGASETNASAFDVASTRAAWQAACESFVLIRPFKKMGIRKSMRVIRSDGKSPTSEDVEGLLETVKTFQAAKAAWEKVTEEISPLFGALWNDGQPEPDQIESALRWQESICAEKLTLVGDNLDALTAMNGILGGFCGEGRILLRPGSTFTQAIQTYDEAVDSFIKAWEQVVQIAGLADEVAGDSDLPGFASAMAARLLGEKGRWQRWCRYRSIRARALNLELAPLVDEFENGGVSAADLEELFKELYARASLRHIIETEPLVRDFFGDEHENKIQDFKSLDTDIASLTRKVVISSVAARRPMGIHDDRQPGEIGLLNREVQKRTRHMAVRKLISDVPSILPLLKPCLLMSPLSVAQYLDAGHPPFDLVIFDEASQIPVCDAVGAIARGRQTIIAGDPKQLPPTSFFQKGAVDEEQLPEDLVADAESILDECRASKISEHRLRWHYRSRHESLIAFSNHHYYDNHLLTYPEPFAEERGVHLHPVSKGVYDRAKSRTNRAEADEIVARIVAHYKDPERSHLSIGAVTFNSEQMRLIETLLDEARLKDAELDELLAQERDEALFVKNLENVQGDERDIVLFSITYGPDANGHVAHNFGPLNQQGGERRLNVAITRARFEVHLYSALRADQINLSRTRALGVKHLKAYLEFAARGASSLVAATSAASLDDYDSIFEQQVAELIRSEGWEVHTQVGCSDYRIDLAVVHPEHEGCYVLGVECDGATYHSAATARDRDRLRQSILEGLGWQFHRIWSTDWFRNPETERERLVERIHLAVKEFTPMAAYENNTPSAAERATEEETQRRELNEVSGLPEAEIRPPDPPKYSQYTNCEPDQRRRHTERFYDYSANSTVISDVSSIIEREGPVSERTLAQRVAEFWGFRRVTKKLRDRIAAIALLGKRMTQTGDVCFYWPESIDSAEYRGFRAHTDEPDNRRDLDDVPTEEQVNAMTLVMERYPGLTKLELLRETAQIFGYSQLTANMQDQLENGFRQFASKTEFQLQDGKVVRKG